MKVSKFLLAITLILLMLTNNIEQGYALRPMATGIEGFTERGLPLKVEHFRVEAGNNFRSVLSECCEDRSGLYPSDSFFDSLEQSIKQEKGLLRELEAKELSHLKHEKESFDCTESKDWPGWTNDDAMGEGAESVIRIGKDYAKFLDSVGNFLQWCEEYYPGWDQLSEEKILNILTESISRKNISFDEVHGWRESCAPSIYSWERHAYSWDFPTFNWEKAILALNHELNLVRLKCLVLDCDNVLWQGVIDKDGIKGINIASEYIEFQKEIKKLKERGVYLAINSKNNLELVLQALRKPEMILKESDFVTIKANWEDKATNLRQIGEELNNIGTDALVFVDDNQRQVDLVKNVIPEALALLFPRDAGKVSRYADMLSAIFYRGPITDEDKRRSERFAAQQLRDEAERRAVSLEEHYRSLQRKAVLKTGEENASYLRRIAQLTQKTNQFNFTQRRYSEDQIEKFYKDENYRIYSLNFSDRSGDFGTVGTLILRKVSEAFWEIDTFCISCELLQELSFMDSFAMFISYVIKDVRRHNISYLKGKYVPGAKNQNIAHLYDLLGQKYDEANKESSEAVIYYIDTSKASIPLPKWLNLSEKLQSDISSAMHIAIEAAA